MNVSRLRALLFASTCIAAACAPAVAATPAPSPKPSPKASGSPHPLVLPTPNMPKIKIHSEFTVEVNAKGQVVKVKTAKSQPSVPMYNAWTYGNVLQMWIRHPDGTAEVGLYKVTYDYDPTTKKITRMPSLVSAGGTWADEEGAANQMIDLARKEAEEHQKKQADQAKNLPSLQKIRGQSTPSPSPSPSPPF
jgi:hypothetical protein